MGCFYSKDCCNQASCCRQASNSPDILKVKISGEQKVLVDSVVSPPSSDLQAEGDDQVHQLTSGRNSDIGINRLDRVSSQFLPPEGSRSVKIPSGNYELRYSYLSQRGYYPEALDKANQDSFCIHTPFGTSPDDHFFGVFDGHGEFGAQCSQFVKRKLCENLLRNSRFHVDPTEACHAAFLLTNSQLHADILDDSMSGTTAITVFVRGRIICVANSGDSRAVIAERRGKELIAVDLSIDQTPYRADEVERVKLCGARVLTLDQIEGLKNPEVQYWGTEGHDDGDPPRVWVQNGMYPGTAFTRSLGDSIAESIGVVATPEIVALDLTENNPFFVVASDGVFEFLSSQAVVDMIAKYRDPHDACAAIVAESYRLWLQYETRTDDITVIIVHVNGLTDTGHYQTGPKIPVLPSQQAGEAAGSESPSTILWNSKNHRARHDLSRARIRVIESSLESGHAWAPPSPSHRKTWEEEAHIERILRDHFLFRKLTDSQCHVLLDCMQRVEVKLGDVVVQQGGEGDCFYVVGSGEFQVLATQVEENGEEVTRVLHRYTADNLSSFGELALMYNKPLQASVHAVTNGTLWALKREDFRGILMSEFSNLSSLRLLRSVDLLSRLTILQLSRISGYLSEVSFSDGQTIIDKNECLSSLYIIQKGQVRLKYDTSLVRSPKVLSLSSNTADQEDCSPKNGEHELDLPEGSHFGEWALLGEQISSLSAVAVGDVVCAVITKEKFDSAVGTLSKLQLEDRMLKNPLISTKECIAKNDAEAINDVQLKDLEWYTGLHATDCSELGLVLLKGSEKILTFRRFCKKKIKSLGKEAQVLREKDIMKSLSFSSCVPQVLSTVQDESYAGILLNTRLTCSLASVLRTPLDESSAQFCASSIVVALQEMHENCVMHRGISPENLMFDQFGRLQLADLRYAKKIGTERSFTICGIADYLAPEIIQGKGYGLSSDWWALGVLIYFMLQTELPFGSWRENELDAVARIAKGQFILPHTFSTEVVDLITKLLEIDEVIRLGSHGADSLRKHPWFADIDWEGIKYHTIAVPVEITARIDTYLKSHIEDTGITSSPSQDTFELDSSEWLEDW